MEKEEVLSRVLCLAGRLYLLFAFILFIRTSPGADTLIGITLTRRRLATLGSSFSTPYLKCHDRFIAKPRSSANIIEGLYFVPLLDPVEQLVLLKYKTIHKPKFQLIVDLMTIKTLNIQ